jgi:hypothetical protein
MSTIELPTYVPAIPLPAPVTSGSGIQTYTDPYGDVWVAANGVNSGAWRRARDVLISRWYRSAALVVPTGSTLFQFDTSSVDNYGLYVPTNGFTAPVTGHYDLYLNFLLGTTSPMLNVQPKKLDGTVLACIQLVASGSQYLGVAVGGIYYLNKADQILPYVYGSASNNFSTGNGNTFATFAYRGTG